MALTAQELRLRFRTGRPQAPPLERAAAREARIQEIDHELVALAQERVRLLRQAATDGP